MVTDGAASEWRESRLHSGIPQGVLLIIYVNDVDAALNNNFITKFADDTKICNSIILEQDRQIINHSKGLVKIFSLV